MFTFSEYVVLLWSNEWKGLWIHSEYVYKHRKWNGIWLLGFYAMCYWVQQIVYTYKVRFEQHEQKKNKCMSGVSDYLKKNRYPYVWRKKYQLKWWLWVDVIGWNENKGGRFFLIEFSEPFKCRHIKWICRYRNNLNKSARVIAWEQRAR